MYVGEVDYDSCFVVSMIYMSFFSFGGVVLLDVMEFVRGLSEKILGLYVLGSDGLILLVCVWFFLK